MKSSYYIQVSGGEIVQDPSVNNWEFEVIATEDEIDELRERFHELQEAEVKTARRSATPILLYHFDAENDIYDEILIGIYQHIHSIGTDKTRKHIESMNIINKEGLHS